MGKPVIYFEYVSPKPQETIDFYAELFGWESDFDTDQNYAMVQTGPDHAVMGGIGGTGQWGDPRVTIYAGVDDIQAYLDRAGQLGGTTVLAPTEVGEYGTVALFSDPAGQVTGLWKRP